MDNATLYQIEALKDFNDVKKGDLGGYVEHIECLSQDGDCWLYDNSMAFEQARIKDNACVMSSAVHKNVYTAFREVEGIKVSVIDNASLIFPFFLYQIS